MLQLMLMVQFTSIVVLAMECIYIFFHWNTKGHSCLFLFCAATLVNNVAYLIIMNAQTPREGMIGIQLCYLGKVWIPLTFFMLAMELCEIRFPEKLYQGLVCIHLFVLILVLTCDKNNLFYTGDRGWEETGMFPHNVMGHTWIYNAYTALIGVYIVVGTAIMIYKLVKTKDKEIRGIYIDLLIADVAMAGGLIAFMLNLTDGYDSTSLGYAIASVVLFIAIFRSGLMDTLSLVQDYVADTIAEGILAVDLNHKMIYCNEPMKKIYPDIKENASEILSNMEQCIGEHDVLRIDGLIYEPKCQPLYQKERLKGYLYVLTDVTERYRYTEELQEQKEIAEAANASKSAFLSVVTHEIRTPMTSIVGMTELILREPDNLTEKQTKYLRNIKTSGDALIVIVNDILDQSKIEAGKMEIVEEPYKLVPLVEDVKMIIENRIGSKPIELLYEIGDDVPEYLNGDSLRIRQILINLMNNAVKFTEKGYIKLTIQCVEQESGIRKLKFSVKDSGQGIKPGDLSKLGQAFTQVDTKRNHKKEGTGLGLSISKDFIALMGGQLEVKSEYGKGTEFFFFLWQKTVKREEIREEKQAWQSEAQFSAPDARILIVDDNEINLMIAQEMLEPVGMTVDIANSGQKAIEMMEEQTYHLVFMDYMMPYMDGIETTKRIRAKAKDEEWDEKKKEYFRLVPIVTLSGDDSENTKELFYSAGVNDFMAKPMKMVSLKNMLLKWLPEEKIIR
ncbi:MAG: ATP-binding protein [Agathobacter sp.]